MLVHPPLTWAPPRTPPSAQAFFNSDSFPLGFVKIHCHRTGISPVLRLCIVSAQAAFSLSLSFARNNHVIMSRSRSRSAARGSGSGSGAGSGNSRALQAAIPGDHAIDVSSSQPSCAPTELDNDTDDDALSDLPRSVLPYRHWTNMVTRVRNCLEIRFPASHRLDFDLAPPECQDWMQHLTHVVNEGLSMRNCSCYKIGITYEPHKRWSKSDYWFLQRMCVSLTSEDCEKTGNAEKNAITFFKSGGDKRCMNRKPGKESYDHSFSPHFLYVVFGSQKQFRRGREMRG